MEKYTCPICGATYSADLKQDRNCYVCQGFGIPDGACRCPRYRRPDGTPTDVIAQASANCPEHRNLVQDQKEAPAAT
jgi:hypothetical protein